MKTILQSAFSKKYREIVISVALFLIFDLGVLILNFGISSQISQDAVGVNMAGRQRMLSQRTVKSLLEIQGEQSTGKETGRSLEELMLSLTLFDHTLAAFDHGGTVIGGNDKPVFLPAVQSAAARSNIVEALAIWLPYKEKLQPILATSNTLDTASLSAAINYALANNLKLLKLMNQLTFELEQVAAHKASLLRRIQTGAIALALINFFVILFHFIKKLEASDTAIREYSVNLEKTNNDLEAVSARLLEAKQETDSIFSAVRQGMFLMDREYIIGTQQSKEVQDIFMTEALAGQNFVQLLRRMLPEKTFDTAKDFLALLMDVRKREKQVLKLNPLAQVEVTLMQPGGGQTTRHLEFTFRRILEGGQIARVFVGVVNVTERVNLEQRLKQSEAVKEKQFELLAGILHADPLQLKEFIATAEAELQQMNDILKEDSSTLREGNRAAWQKQKLDRLFRCAHNIKGNAAFLKLGYFEKAAHQFEDKVAEMRAQTTLNNDDFIGLVMRLAELMGDLNEVRDLVGRLAGLRSSLSPKPTATADPLLATLEELANTLSSRLGKQVAVDTANFSPQSLPLKYRPLVRDTLIQLTRNSLVHGIESPEDRLRSRKSSQGVIQILPLPAPKANECGFVYRDDGRGLQLDKIRKRAAERGLLGAENGEHISDDQLAACIFESGFSTMDETTAEAGRGVGLDLLKQKVVDDLGGEIRVSFVPGQFCEFHFLLPA